MMRPILFWISRRYAATSRGAVRRRDRRRPRRRWRLRFRLRPSSPLRAPRRLRRPFWRGLPASSARAWRVRLPARRFGNGCCLDRFRRRFDRGFGGFRFDRSLGLARRALALRLFLGSRCVFGDRFGDVRRYRCFDSIGGGVVGCLCGIDLGLATTATTAAARLGVGIDGFGLAHRWRFPPGRRRRPRHLPRRRRARLRRRHCLRRFHCLPRRGDRGDRDDDGGGACGLRRRCRYRRPRACAHAGVRGGLRLPLRLLPHPRLRDNRRHPRPRSARSGQSCGAGSAAGR